MSRERDERLILRPTVFAKLRWVRAHYQSAVGRIESEWRHDGGATVYTFVIPATATATIDLSTPSPQALTVNGLPIAKAGISAKISGHRIRFVVKPGQYQVRAPSPTDEPESHAP